MDSTNLSMHNFTNSCQHFITMMMNKGEAETLVEEKLKQDASAFQTIPVKTKDSKPTSAKLMQDKNLKDSESSVAQDGLLEKVSIVKCTSCDKSVALLVSGKYQSLSKILHDEIKTDGWLRVESEYDSLVLFVLNQIIYKEYEVPNENELQVEYSFPHSSDFTKILWVKGNAVGFYSAKLKGSLDLEPMDWYRMTVLDTIFIRYSERRKGYALSAIKDILLEFPDQNIGFSTPISRPMLKVLKKHLESHSADRMKLWEVDGCGSEGNCQILWFLLRRR